jgi:hypothetical protein
MLWWIVPHRNTFPTQFERVALFRVIFFVLTGESFTAAIRSQSGRVSADLRTTNRPDAGSRTPPARKQKKQQKKKRPSVAGAVFHPVRKQNEYLSHRAGLPGTGSTSSMPILVGAALIAVAILLSTLVTAIGTRYVGIEGPSEENAWLVDRLTGSVYRCQAPERGRASCDAEITTGSIAGRPK